VAIEDTAVVVPAYNEASVIAPNLQALCADFPVVVCVDDGSRDSTYEAARTTPAHVLHHCTNLGQGAALQTGIEYALTLPVRYVATFDADGQHRVSDLIAMRQTLVESGDDIVLGSRFLGAATDIPRAKRWLLRAAVVFSRWTTGLALTDTHNGLRVFTRDVAAGLQLKEPGYGHASEILDAIARHHWRVREAPVTIDYTEYSKAKGQSMLNAMNIATDTLAAKVLGR